MSKTLSKIITYLLVVLLCLGVAGVVLVAIQKLTATSGMYVVYAGQEITSDNDGISIEWNGNSYTAEFTINNTEDWGIYSVEDCSVKVVPNVTTEKDFDFTVNSKNYKYSNVSDLSAAFTEDNGSLSVDENGNFSLYFNYYFTDLYLDTAMNTVLNNVYGSTVTLDSAPDISSYPYFAVQVTSPDGGSVISIPFVVKGTGDSSGGYVYVESIELDYSNIAF